MKKIFLLAIVCLAFFMNGCSASTEIDKLMIVSGISIDGGEEYDITTQIVNLSDASQNNLSPILLKTQGRTIVDAMAELAQLEGQKLYFTHAQTILIGSDILKQGEAYHIINLLNTAPRFRSSIRLAATAGKAFDVLSTEPNTDPISAFSIQDSIDESSRMLKAPDVPFYVFLNDTLESGIDGILPLVDVMENDDAHLPYVCGTALFKDTVMVDTLTDEETKYLLLAKGKVPNALYTTADHSFLINSGNSKMQFKDGSIVLALKLEVYLVEGSDPGNTELERILKEDINTGLNMLLSKLKAIGCDPIGIGRCIKRSSPKYWSEIYPEDWDRVYNDLVIDTEIKISIVPSSKLAEKEN